MLFAYGTLQDSDVLAAVLGRPIPAAAFTNAQLAGFTIVHYPDRTYPALVPAADSLAAGKIIRGLDPRDLALIDVFEGEEYRRAQLAVRTNETLHRAFAYLPTAAITAWEAPWSLCEWTIRHKSAFMHDEFSIIF